LIDWIDQAFLLMHLEAATRAEIDAARGRDAQGGAATRLALRRIGIRSATDLLRAFGSSDGSPPSAPALRARGLDPCQIETVLRLLADEPGLDPVWNWKTGAAGRSATPLVVSRSAAPVAGTARRHRTQSPASASPSM
jgi:hypothetical protein